MSVVWLFQTSESQRRLVRNAPRPFGLRLKSPPAALLDWRVE